MRPIRFLPAIALALIGCTPGHGTPAPDANGVFDAGLDGGPVDAADAGCSADTDCDGGVACFKATRECEPCTESANNGPDDRRNPLCAPATPFCIVWWPGRTPARCVQCVPGGVPSCPPGTYCNTLSGPPEVTPTFACHEQGIGFEAGASVLVAAGATVCLSLFENEAKEQPFGPYELLPVTVDLAGPGAIATSSSGPWQASIAVTLGDPSSTPRAGAQACYAAPAQPGSATLSAHTTTTPVYSASIAITVP